MAFNFQSFAQEVHENAKAHGWYDPPPTAEERVAAIHSEWSEAFQAWRKDEPAYAVKQVCMTPEIKHIGCKLDSCTGCNHHIEKPDGWAVELIDGVLRILEWMASDDVCVNLLNVMMPPGIEAGKEVVWDGADSLPSAVSFFHKITSEATLSCNVEVIWSKIGSLACCVIAWLESISLDPITIMQQKHAYNRTRPYRHGGKKC